MLKFRQPRRRRVGIEGFKVKTGAERTPRTMQKNDFRIIILIRTGQLLGKRLSQRPSYGVFTLRPIQCNVRNPILYP